MAPRFPLTRFPAPSHWATRGEFSALDWTEILHQCQHPDLWPGEGTIPASVARLPAWCAVRFRDDSRFASKDEVLAERETRERVTEVHAVAIEYIDEPLADADHMQRWWSDFGFIAHTTAFHEQPIGEKPPGPRWRVIIPFLRPVDRATGETVALWARHPRHNAGAVADVTSQVFRLLPVPAIAPGGFAWTSHDGPALDPMAAVAELTRWENEERVLRATEALRPASLRAGIDLLLTRAREPALRPRISWSGAAQEAPAAADLTAALPSPWPRFEQAAGPLGPGRLALLLGATGDGRTSFAVQVALSAARQGHPVLVVVVGAGADEMVARMVASTSHNAPWAALLDGSAEAKTLEQACGRLEGTCPLLYVWSPPAEQRTSQALVEKAHALMEAADGRPPFIVLDSVEGWSDGAAQDRALREVSGALCDLVHPGSLAPDWPGAAALVVRGLRSDEARHFHTAESLAAATAELAETSVLEHDASLVLALVAERVPGPRRTHLTILKNRHGQTGTFELTFDPQAGRFAEV